MVNNSSIPSHWRLQRFKYTLTGTKCVTCNDFFYPPRNFCKHCRRKGKIEEFRFKGKGEIISHTIIRVAPDGFEKNAPYGVALIKLDEGPIITGQVIGDVENISAGKRVRTIFRRMHEDGPGGQIFYGLKWEIVDSANY